MLGGGGRAQKYCQPNTKKPPLADQGGWETMCDRTDSTLTFYPHSTAPVNQGSG
jgi:hypothetical protein